MIIKLATFNVKGLGDFKKRRKVFTWLRDNKYDIIFLQEIHVTREKINSWVQEWGYKAFFSGNSSASAGIGILFLPNFPLKILEYKEVKIGRIQRLKIEINDITYTLFNIYGPNNDDATFYHNLDMEIEETKGENIIVGGDFNVTLDMKLDKKGGATETKRKQREKLTQVIEKYDLCDIWRFYHPTDKVFTWHSNSKPKVFCRLDFILISSNMLNNSRTAKIVPGISSDHALVYFKLDSLLPARGPGCWKLNTKLISDEDYKNTIRSKIKEITEINSGANANTLWELIKGSVRQESIVYAAQKQKERVKREKSLQKEIEGLNDAIHNSSSECPYLLTELETKQNDLEKIYDEKVQGIILRAKSRWVEEGEKNTKYFANLEKRNYENKVITNIQVNGIQIHEPSEILNEQKKYFENLYSKASDLSNNSDIFPTDIPKIDDDKKKSCEGILTETELAESLQTMKRNKSPGSDGIPCEFYKEFWPEIKKFLLDSLNYSFEEGKLTTLQRQGIITLLPKKDRDRTSLKNWRPITLLNTDYKIAAKAIANRLKKILPSIIHNSQTGFMKNRYIGENIRLIHDVITYAKDNQNKGLIMFVDFEKAFDSVNHDYMFKALEQYNFGKDLIQWIKLLYANAQSCVTNNGHMSKFFQINRGTRQGCPLSPYIFNIMIEILSHLLRQNKDIQGFKLFDKHVKLTAYADDVTIFMDGTQKDLATTCSVLDSFNKISGLKVNYEKSAILRIGTLRNTQVRYCTERRFAWTSKGTKTLGIYFTNDTNNITEMNMIDRIKQISTLLDKWKLRNLTLLGKITVIKMLAFPIILYPLTNLPDPNENLIKTIKKKLFTFLWNDKPDKVARKVMCQPIERGGLKMLDIETYLSAVKISWIKRYCDPNNEGEWKTTFRHNLKKIGGTNFFNSTLNEKHLKLYITPKTFFYDVIKHWNRLTKIETPHKNVLEQSLWYNSNICQENTPINSKKWADKGILQINHIVEDCNILSFSELKAKFQLDEEDIFTFHKVKKSIPEEWIRNMARNQISEEEKMIEKIQRVPKCTKYIYSLLLDNMTAYIHSQRKWEETLEDVSIEWDTAYNLPRQCSSDTHILTFQFKFLHRIVPTNSFLLRIKKSPSSLCDLCWQNVETLQHLFWECEVAQGFWSQIQLFLEHRNISFPKCRHTVFFGDKYLPPVVNLITILAKKYIYQAKCSYRKVTIESFKQYLLRTYEIEQKIALKNRELKKFQSKWLPVLPI